MSKKNKKGRSQGVISHQKPNDLVSVLFVALIIAVSVMIFALLNPKEAPPKEFSPPPFDDNAIAGSPSVPEENGYEIISSEQLPYSVGLCGRVYIYGSKADVYFTNPSSNEVWMKLRVFDSSGNVIGETGLIIPGEYIKGISLEPTPESGDTITLKVMTYQPETYKSEGSFSLTPLVFKSDN